MSYLTDRKRVTGLGSSRDGVGHWVSQRVTALALIPLSIGFLFPFMRSLGAGREAVLQTYSSPLNAMVAAMFFIVLCQHLATGLQVVIEDYIHNHRRQVRLMLLNRMFWGMTTIVAVFSVAKIALGA
jgi:succinate dehydrogenase / fumarate reductase membrane anchor subunit